MSHSITLLRHALSTTNLDQVVQGQHDYPLSEEGRHQAKALATHWVNNNVHFDHVFSSPLLRASETAEIIGEVMKLKLTPLKKGQTREEDRYMWGFRRSPNPHIYPFPLLKGSFFSALKIEFDEIWMEQHLGAAESVEYESVREWYQGRSRPTAYEPAFESGESEWDIFLRAGRAIQMLIRRPPGAYLVVSHGALLGTVLLAIIGISPGGGRLRPVKFNFDNTGYALLNYEIQTARWSIQALNHTHHLDPDRDVI